MNTHDITTLSDRKLLQLAVKFCGYNYQLMCDPIESGEPYNEFFHVDGRYWNPLTDDGDAFRLAVRLNLVIEPPRDNGFAHVYHYHRSLEVAERRSAITHEAELTATRRAIVRAAAEIGRKMP